MDKLKGSGSTFSTSGKRWYPFQGKSPAAAASIGRRARIRNAMPSDKASARAACDAAIAEHPIRRIPTGKRTRSAPHGID